MGVLLLQPLDINEAEDDDQDNSRQDNIPD